ncbi:MAG: T9SS C-terminal target domain-containing protein, partial [Bacteroidetes bacterium]
ADDGFDFSRVKFVVFAMGNIQGSPFNLSFDDIGFDQAVVTSSEPGAADLPSAYVLTHAYPNPFNPQTQFELTVRQTQPVRVALYDALGREVALLHDGILPGQTRHTFRIDGQHLSSGLYLYRVVGEAFSETRSVVLLK